MATLADELLADFDDSGSDGEGQQNGDFMDDDEDGTSKSNGLIRANNDGMGMDLDGDEDDGGDGDEEMSGMVMDGEDDEEEAKAKVEKMKLGNVEDVRSVARLMKQLEPILEVSNPQACHLKKFGLHSMFIALTVSDYRKSHTTKTYRQRNQPLTLAR